MNELIKDLRQVRVNDYIIIQIHNEISIERVEINYDLSLDTSLKDSLFINTNTEIIYISELMENKKNLKFLAIIR